MVHHLLHHLRPRRCHFFRSDHDTIYIRRRTNDTDWPAGLTDQRPVLYAFRRLHRLLFSIPRHGKSQRRLSSRGLPTGHLLSPCDFAAAAHPWTKRRYSGTARGRCSLVCHHHNHGGKAAPGAQRCPEQKASDRTRQQQTAIISLVHFPENIFYNSQILKTIISDQKKETTTSSSSNFNSPFSSNTACPFLSKTGLR